MADAAEREVLIDRARDAAPPRRAARPSSAAEIETAPDTPQADADPARKRRRRRRRAAPGAQAAAPAEP